MGVIFNGGFAVTTNGPLQISQGGTGATTAQDAINALLPTQTGNSGKVLSTDGTNVSWITGGAGGSPGGSNTQIQFNDSGSFGGSASFVINKTTGALTATGTFTGAGVNVNGAADTNRWLKFQTATADRWLMGANSTSESGSASGSDFELKSVADNGATQNTVFTADRSSGIVDFASMPTVGGVGITSDIDASGITTGTISTARLGSGSASSSTYLRGDNTWATVEATPAGISAQVQFNDGGSFGASTSLTWITGTSTLNATNFAGNGSALTSLNASNLSSGTVGTARLGSGTADSTTFLRGDGSWATPTATVTTLTGSSTVTPSISTKAVYVGLAPSSAYPAIYFVNTGATTDEKKSGFYVDNGGNIFFALYGDSTGTSNIINITRSGTTASEIELVGTAITLTGAVSGTSFSGSGSGLTSLNASNLSSGTVGTARLGTGTADSTTFLRGDGSWATPTATADASTLTGSTLASGVTASSLTSVGTLTSLTVSGLLTVGGYKESVTTANTSTAYTITISSATLQILTLTGNATFTFPTATAGLSFTLLLKQDATGGRTATWPAAVKWPGGTTPTITSTASKMDKFIFTADGTNWYGSVAGQNY